jgi:uncharacterized protein YjbI with pentapeptide repeats
MMQKWLGWILSFSNLCSSVCSRNYSWRTGLPLILLLVTLAGGWLDALPAAAADYNREFLVGKDFSGQALTDDSFTKANLRSANFSGSDLQGVSFFGANLEDANLEGANLSNATLDSARFVNTKLKALTLPTYCCAMICRKYSAPAPKVRTQRRGEIPVNRWAVTRLSNF